jgi:hypothetical protein
VAGWLIVDRIEARFLIADLFDTDDDSDRALVAAAREAHELPAQ